MTAVIILKSLALEKIIVNFLQVQVQNNDYSALALGGN